MAVSQTFFLKFQMWQSHTINCQLKFVITCKGYFCSGSFPFCKYYSNPNECRPGKELFRLNHTTVASINLAPLHYKHHEKVLLQRALPRLVERTFKWLPTGVSLLLNPSDTYTRKELLRFPYCFWERHSFKRNNKQNHKSIISNNCFRPMDLQMSFQFLPQRMRDVFSFRQQNKSA